MEIEHFDDGKKGHFKAVENGIEAGIMTYVWDGDNKFIIDHTLGNPEFKGIGIQLFNSAIEFARKKNLKIIPLCPFAKKMFDKKHDVHDVLAA